MQLTSTGFADGETIPDQFAFAAPDADNHFRLSDNRNPQLAWTNVPAGTQSLVLLCTDPDAPTKPDDVNQADREVPADLPRANFHHWVMVDITPDLTEIAEGECSAEVSPGGKRQPPGPKNTRQGRNNYTDWFAGDPKLGGTYLGYDGPAPPWNDALAHRYQFRLLALDIARCGVEGDSFGADDVLESIQDHILAEATLTGIYTLNPRLR